MIGLLRMPKYTLIFYDPKDRWDVCKLKSQRSG